MKSLALISFLLLTANFLFQYIGLIQFTVGANQLSENTSNYIYIGCIAVGWAIGVFWKKIFSAKEVRKKLYITVQSGISFLLAYCISTYGFAKIIKEQFSVPEYIKDIPIAEQSGFWLTWYYFGYSYPFSIIIAIGQIGGSLLLLFNRTRLLGTFILLPIMLNIVFVNIFYDISFGAFLNSLIYTLGLVFLLLLNYKELIEIFFRTTNNALSFQANNGLKIAIKTLLIVSALGSTLLTQHLFKDNSIVKGVYATDQIIRNNALVDLKRESDSTIRKMYFDFEGLAIVEYKDHTRRSYNNYEIDNDQKVLSIFFENGSQKTDTLRAEITDLANLQFVGQVKNNPVRITLKKIR